MKPSFKVYIAFLVLTLISSCARNPVTGKREFMLMSTKQEIAMGRDAAPQIVAHFGLYEDAKLQQFIETKGQQMAAISHRKDLKYSFKIVDSPAINAFAVPGGFVYFTRGIMAHFNNEAEFAGVLGHEIGHISARHTAQQQSKAILAQAGLIVGIIAAPGLAQFAEAAQQGVGLMFLKFGRDDERESDRLGVEYSTKIGYDAKEMAEFFETLKRSSDQAGGGQLPNFLSTHPSPEERLKKVREMAIEWQQKVPGTSFEVGRDSYLRLIDGMIYGEDPKQGFFEEGAFFHPVLKFRFGVPQDWTTQNSPQAVQMAPKDGNALMMLTLAQGENLETAARAILEQYKLTPTESQQTTVNGLPALAIVAEQQPQRQQQQQQQQQQPIRTLIYLIQYGGNIYNLMGASYTQNFNNYAQTFLTVAQSFSELTDASKLNRQPEKIQVRPVQQSGTMAQALQALNVPAARHEELSILNGMLLTDRVERGMLIKIVAR
jgi:predicted Zn-dependent protease